MLYALLKYNSRLSISVVLPLVSLLYYTYVFNTGDSIERWGTDIFIYHPLWRGIADMSIGVIFWHIFTRVENKLNIKIVGLLSIIALMAMIALAFCKTHLDSYVLIITPVLLTGCFCGGSVLNKIFRHPVWAFLGGITFELYLIHIAVIRLAWFAYGRIHLPLLVFIILYLLAVVFAAWGLKSTVEYMTRLKWKKLV